MPLLRKKKIAIQLLLFLLPFILLSIGITSFVLSMASYTFFSKTIKQDYGNIIRSSAGEIRLFMENARRNLDSLALYMTATKLDNWQIEMALTAFLQTNPQFASVSLYAPDGKTIVAGVAYNQNPTPLKRKVIEKLLAGKTDISGLMLAKGDIPYVNIAVPVFHLGKVTKILWASLNLKSVWDVLEGIQIGKTGQVYIMDLSGRYLAHRDIDRVVRTAPAEKPDILKELQTPGSTTTWMEKKHGVWFFNLGTDVPGLNWIIVISQPKSEIYAYLYRNFFWALILTIGICIIATGLIFRWVRRFLKPVHTLHRQVQIIGTGDLDQKIEVETDDEIGDLGHAFNDMTDALKGYIRREIETAQELVHAQNLAVLGTTSSKVTHEVGNFLNNIDMAVSGLQSEQLSSKGQKILDIVKNESRRVKDFIQNILQFVKKPEPHLQRQPVDLIINNVLMLYQAEAEKHAIRFELDWPSDIPMINIDPGLMHHVINNLVKNSLDAIHTGPGIIRIEGRAASESIVIRFSDTGSGIDPENLAHLFEPFYTTKGSKGTGLGMSIVQNIVDSHHGTIECQSTPGEGTTFYIRLPRY